MHQTDASLPENLIEKSNHYWHRLVETGVHENWINSHQNEIRHVMALSDFIAESIISDPSILNFLLIEGQLHESQLDYTHIISEALTRCEDEPALIKTIRIARRKLMVHIAWRDLTGLQPIALSLEHVSSLANTLINQTYQWLYQHLCKRYGTPMGPLGPQPMLILGMGKLGGQELNFSSDIDLIFVYPENGEISDGRKPIEHQQFFTKLAQKLINALHQTTAEGQVFRVDMRLRPFGESGPLVTHFAALEDYLQDQGREWERFAMVKARIINDGSPYSQGLKDILKPFVYRRYLDFGAIDALRQMKYLISQEVRRRQLSHNIKLGAGGIREVEFIVQSFQLIRGGRLQALQTPSLLKNLTMLVELDILPKDDMQSLKQSYLFLRKLEHFLQEFADKQTQTLPDDPLNQSRLAYLYGQSTFDDVLALITPHMHAIHAQFQMLIGDHEESEDANKTPELQDASLLWQLDLNEVEQLSTLIRYLSEAESLTFAQQLCEFKQAMAKKPIGKKGRDTLSQLMPQLIGLVLTQYTDRVSEAVPRTLHVLEAIYGRTTYLQLLNENQGALNQLVRLCSASTWIAQQITRFPILLDELLNPYALYHPTPLDEYHSDLRQAMLRIEQDDLEVEMESLRQYKLSQQLRIAAADITQVMPIMKVSDHLTYLAEAIIHEVVNKAWYQITEKHGCPPGTHMGNKAFAVIGYGKLGGLELGYGSDLDLVFVHQAERSGKTDGEKPVDVNHFYTKLAQRIMHLFSTKTGSGELYEIDMRLRPSGNAGLLVCHIDGFETYQKNEAWTWEHQALTRTRVIYGNSDLEAQFTDVRRRILCQQREQSELAADVAKMRKKMRRHLNKGDEVLFDIKQDRGGITDIEFLVQYWVLNHAHYHPDIALWSDNVRVLSSLANADIISESTCETLTHAYLTLRDLSHRASLKDSKLLPLDDVLQTIAKQVDTIWREELGRYESSDE
ncbi:bifunctional [glutamate--ammonia ligase]-adenylyl-L-tyrosine phosphorylase/[glutamate--ammonia-ligase] adenylyltransferase [Aestuariibacter sp. AA17]|uniref:Bifunctional glutamine synthetase adenylyltransferase/adenylyl-removing enzyme n=1 Tax=Fluctibacter corallii TaxID=2984329 RepID=A0ABT3ABQ9_9ALTE|nr:bifunctional [glutamate--ammonia ligase]-adenylyl-L-tyrosine phosphorylase/[glutamate--ammonia-ligase] adenylyltransferase [Aestuariibacter sp. AA17]MCV2886059.1 bifunctional [glutamate--ammonia ligase]-adenylyl-L-tyrosine phosphorylase/[glutamate--ammonia-ligase] adenylyltransferase [Aestuariibacter sp. AA17]